MPYRLPHLHKPGPQGAIRIGCAGWSLTSAVSTSFPGEGSHIERYGRVLTCVEINSSFYKPHREQTYEKWAQSVPESFRFSVKLPKAITHDARLVDTEALIDEFLLGASQLGDKLGCWLTQLPPSLPFEHDLADTFFKALRERTKLPVACEARHPTWFTADAAALLKAHHIAYVDADPIPDDCEIKHRADASLVYVRLHGSPELYKSSYDYTYLDHLAHTLQARAKKSAEVWCIFDNTAQGNAQPNALNLMERLRLHHR
ncbi:DUF72 domain-containing protein [Caballeronia sp. LZ025]|uniref:DUF72 domain-containing protein n=1 Tax=Caballeronia TaxID=1827195 RepID=UPI001FCFBAAD|nr:MULTISPECIES: DUF72 domain-containing protein [Caballeronia]MDR5732677.1 DUF72 domain-containing protein [Caballeronia sp. LZ025]